MPVVEQALRNPVPLRDQFHRAAFGFHLRDQRSLLFNAPFPPPLEPGKDLHFGHANLLLERQKQASAAPTFGDSRASRYTSQAERLHIGVISAPCAALGRRAGGGCWTDRAAVWAGRAAAAGLGLFAGFAGAGGAQEW